MDLGRGEETESEEEGLPKGVGGESQCYEKVERIAGERADKYVVKWVGRLSKINSKLLLL